MRWCTMMLITVFALGLHTERENYTLTWLCCLFFSLKSFFSVSVCPRRSSCEIDTKYLSPKALPGTLKEKYSFFQLRTRENEKKIPLEITYAKMCLSQVISYF